MAEDLEKARKELEELYLGVPDESVNLTFQHFVQLTTQQQSATNNNYSELPIILDFNPPNNQPVINAAHDDKFIVHGHLYHGTTPDRNSRRVVESSTIVMGKNNYDNNNNKDEMSYNVSVMSMSQTGRRRQGIPHSNICTLCTTYIYLFRHRCLVCGRVYCRQCVRIGMGEMAEGRKCVDCLGRKFSPRYIEIAGQTGCWMGYSTATKQQELKWAEKGPRVKPTNRSCRSIITSLSTSPTTAHSPASTPSFVINSPYTPTHHDPLPF